MAYGTNYYTNPMYPAYNQQMQPQVPMTQAQQMPQPAPQNNSQGLLWVSGEAGAKAWLLPPNASVLLMDSEQQRFYIKTTDTSGMPGIRTFDYKEVKQDAPIDPLIPPVTAIPDNTPTRKEFDDLWAKYEELSKQIKSEKPSGRKKEVTDNE